MKCQMEHDTPEVGNTGSLVQSTPAQGSVVDPYGSEGKFAVQVAPHLSRHPITTSVLVACCLAFLTHRLCTGTTQANRI